MDTVQDDKLGDFDASPVRDSSGWHTISEGERKLKTTKKQMTKSELWAWSCCCADIADDCELGHTCMYRGKRCLKRRKECINEFELRLRLDSLCSYRRNAGSGS